VADQRQLEFFLLRYVADAIRDEPVNIGIVLFDGRLESGSVLVRMTRDWRRVRCADPDADLEMLQALEHDLRVQLAEVRGRAGVMRRLQESFSNSLRLSPAQSCLGEEATAEIEALARMYLERPLRSGRHQVSRRERMVRALRDSFQQAGLEKFIEEQIRVAEFTHAGDPLKIDFGYRVKGAIKMFHATPLSASVDTAKVLAFSYPAYADGLYRARNIVSALTAIVEDDLDRRDERIAFALYAMEKSSIQIVIESEIPIVAEKARIELQA
jgi:hypothetical protein